MAALTRSKREEVIHALWKDVLAEAGTHRKGRLLEDLLALIFKSIPGFEQAQTDRRNADEQIDLLVPNDSSALPWQQTQSQYFLVECKSVRQPERTGNVLVVPINIAQLDELVNAMDRSAKLKELHDRAVLDTLKGP
jgi:hypothetical protein